MNSSLHPRARRLLRQAGLAGLAVLMAALWLKHPHTGDASSHREAPLISSDPLADNTDLYAFRTPEDPSTVTIVANYIPLEAPDGGPNYHTFGENIRYEIHIKNQTSAGALGTAKDDITYRFTFTQENQDPTTFFNIRLGQQNLKTTYRLQKSEDGGATFRTIITDGIVPPNNIGPRSIEGAAGLNTTYSALTNAAITPASTGERVFAGPRDDPFFVDLGGIFDLGGIRNEFGGDASNEMVARDAVAGFNTHAIVLQIPIEDLQKDGKSAGEATSILDPEFVIGVWASASRPQIRTLSPMGEKPTYSGPWVQVSRLGMPLTNEAVIPIGEKDYWNAVTPYSTDEQEFVRYFANPELALYMGNGAFGAAVPGLSEDLKIQTMSYPALGDLNGNGSPGLNFTNEADGVWEVAAAGVDLAGTAFAVPTRPNMLGSPTALAAPGMPRLVDVFPIFYFGVPNASPYQLATGKTGGPLSAGKPFIHTFLPITQTPDGGLWGGDMLRLNMATPVTERNSDEYRGSARQGLIRAAAIGLTAPPFNTTTDLEFIPHMDGFPNGRRLEDDVTTIALQAVGGLVLAAVGLPFDDATAGDYSDLASPLLVSQLAFVAGPTQNDLPFSPDFPYLADPHNGYSYVKQLTADAPPSAVANQRLEDLGIGVPQAFILDQNYPNPFNPSTTISYQVSQAGPLAVRVYDLQGRLVQTLAEGNHTAGKHTVNWDATNMASGTYFYRIESNGQVLQAKKALLVK